jgi:hypothetical protein
MTPEQRVGWEQEIRSLYHDGMVRVVVTPTWAKLIDFDTTLPSAVEALIRQRESVSTNEQRGHTVAAKATPMRRHLRALTSTSGRQEGRARLVARAVGWEAHGIPVASWAGRPRPGAHGRMAG